MDPSFRGLEEEGINYGSRPLYRGKVRDVLDLGENLLLVASDRISAFDRVLGSIPHKGEILNRLAIKWLKDSSHIVPNHLIRQVGSRAALVRKARVLPLEIIVRAYLSGSAWRAYQAGADVSGHLLPRGMRKNQAFPKPIITPSTKAQVGDHDEAISVQEILGRGILDEDLWQQVEDYALQLFAEGQKRSAERGLILVDSKYEMGVDSEGKLMLVDEVHTPDSSRFWYAESYEEAFEKGNDPRALDKEFLRAWLLEQGFNADIEVPELPEELCQSVSERYKELWYALTGEEFRPILPNIEAERKELQVFLS